MARVATSLNGTLILRDGDTTVQYSLENVFADHEAPLHGAPHITLTATTTGDHYVDLPSGPDDVFALLLELYGEQARLGASAEALAVTRDRIRRHVEKGVA